MRFSIDGEIDHICFPLGNSCSTAGQAAETRQGLA
jgi:hypothetical protein